MPSGGRPCNCDGLRSTSTSSHCRHLQATPPRGNTRIYSDFYINTLPNPVEALMRRSHFTDMSSSDEAIHILPGIDEAKARHTMSDTDEADTTRPGTDEAKAAHLSELTKPDIFITGHRQVGGMWLSIAGATDVPLHSSIPPHHHHRLHRALGEDETRRRRPLQQLNRRWFAASARGRN